MRSVSQIVDRLTVCSSDRNLLTEETLVETIIGAATHTIHANSPVRGIGSAAWSFNLRFLFAKSVFSTGHVNGTR
jgi:hypothetical protein